MNAKESLRLLTHLQLFCIIQFMHLRVIRERTSLLIVCGFLVGCSTGASNIGTASSDLASADKLIPGAEEPIQEEDGFLYVSNNDSNRKLGTVSVYDASGPKSPIKSISKAMFVPNGLAVDTKGDLYVVQNGSLKFSGSLVEYAPHTSKVIRTITTGIDHPDGVALDSFGNIYVANFSSNTVAVYGPQGTTPIRTLSDGIGEPENLAFDGKGNLFVVNYESPVVRGHARHGWVSEYDASTMALVTEISDGVNHPASLAFDRTASLLAVSNTGETKSGAYSVNVYDTAKFELVRSIHKDVHYPTDLAFDKDGSLYILSKHYGSTESGGVLVVPPGASTASKIITNGIRYPNSMILGNTGDVYVANGKVCTIHLICNHGSVSMYESRTFNLIKHTQDGIEGAVKMVIGPKD